MTGQRAGVQASTIRTILERIHLWMVRARRFRSLESDGSTSRQRPAEGGSRVWGSLDDSWGNYFPYINGKDRHHSHGSRHVYVDWVGSNRRRSRQDGTNRLWTSW